jgi:hypothetical protein
VSPPTISKARIVKADLREQRKLIRREAI